MRKSIAIEMLLFVLTVLLGISGVANALTIIETANYLGSDYNLIYEDDSIYGGLVWLDYTKGSDTRQNQVDWASGLNGALSVTLDPGYTSTIEWSTGWRLPSAGDNPQIEYNQNTSEMGHLYYVSLGNLGYFATATDTTYPQTGWGLQNTGPFSHLQDDFYWSGILLLSLS